MPNVFRVQKSVIIMKKYLKQINLLILAAVLPFVQGCGAGGGIASLTSFLFGGGGGIGSFLPLGIAAATGGGTELAALHNPEPASMLLVGGGMMAMTYFRSRKNRNTQK